MLRHLALALFGAVFLTGGWQLFRQPTGPADRARQAGLPVTDDFVRLNGLAMVAATLGLQLPSTRRLSASVLSMQMPPITLIGHRFWEFEPGPQRDQQRIHFLKNLSLFGACLYIAAGDRRR